MSGMFSQFGAVDESTYGTAVAVSRFYEFQKESLKGDYGRIESKALRNGQRVLRSDRFAINPKGAKGSVDLEVLTKGFGFWLKHMLGAVSTSAVGTAGDYTHTATLGTLTGKSFTAQVGRPFVGGTTGQPFTYGGGKVGAWSVENSVDGILQLSLDMDFASESILTTGANALQTVSYPAASEIMTFIGGALTVDAGSVPVKDVSVKCDNGLATDRYFLRGAIGKKEPLETGMRKIDVGFTADFDSMSLYNKVASATAAGALGAVVLTWAGPTLVGTGSLFLPTFSITCPAVRFDGDTPNVGGPDSLEVKMKGLALDAGAGPISVVYKSVDITP
jgi:hypothetical protein